MTPNGSAGGSTLNRGATLVAARGRWPHILAALNISVPATPREHGPCPACGGKDRFRFDDLEGRGTWFCNQCDPKAGDGLGLIQNVKQCDFVDAIDLVAGVLGHAHVNVRQTPQIVAQYDYTDEMGNLLFQTVRLEPKDFRQRRLDENGEWIWNLKDTRRVLYRLPHVLQATDAPLLFHEGEKAVEAAIAAGLPGAHTTTAGGANAPKKTDFNAVKGRQVIICPDHDEPGECYLRDVAELATAATAASVKVLRLPDLPPKGDVVEWLQAGGTAEQFAQLIAQAQPISATNPSLLSEMSGPSSDEWPVLESAAVHGLAGEIVKTIEPHTESDQVAILVQLLIAFGSCLNRGPHFRAEADRHGLNLNAVLVGETAKGRKGTSWGHIRRLFKIVDQDWADTRILGGLSSGEGLIWAVRDEIKKEEPVREKGRVVDYQTVVVDPGVTDKRLLVMESEFASTLRVMSREGNTLSAIIRQAWDSGDLRTMTKNCPAQSTGAHISIVAHITRDELCRSIDTAEASNGFCNRFLWVCVKRSKVLPEGGSLNDAALGPLGRRLSQAVQFGRGIGEIKRDEDARTQWCAVYPALSEGKPGLLGGVVSRAEAQVMRLACLYALLDMSYVVTPVHLQAALALWEYCEASAKYVFGQRLGDPVADALFSELRKQPNGLTRTEIRDFFARNLKSHEIDRGLGVLAKQNLVRREDVHSGGRPVERWLAVTRATT